MLDERAISVALITRNHYQNITRTRQEQTRAALVTPPVSDAQTSPPIGRPRNDLKRKEQEMNTDSSERQRGSESPRKRQQSALKSSHSGIVEFVGSILDRATNLCLVP